MSTGPNFRTTVLALGYCCPYSFVRINIGPNDTVAKLALKANCSERCIKKQRKWVREGISKCEDNPKCLKACWLEPPKGKT